MKKILVMVNRDFVLYNFRIELVERLLQENMAMEELRHAEE